MNHIYYFSRADLEKQLSFQEVITSVSDVYRAKAMHQTCSWPTVIHHFEELSAVMDIKSGYDQPQSVYGMKILGTFPHNARQGLPVFQGLLLIMDGNTGLPLALMDASYITCMRTGAAGALGVKLFSADSPQKLLVIGAGKQSIYQIAASLLCCPSLTDIYVAALTLSESDLFIENCREQLISAFSIPAQKIHFHSVTVQDGLKECRSVITVTPSRNPIVKKDWVLPGCIGADMPGKEELDPAIIASASVFTDDTAQCINAGEIELPIKQGIFSPQQIRGEIGQVLTGQIKGRISPEEMTIFDATGLALLDIAVGKLVYTNSLKHGWDKYITL